MGGRLARLGAAGAGVLGRTALGEVRKLGAGPERREAIDAATREANALDVMTALAGLKGPLLKLGQFLSQQSHTLPETWVRQLSLLQRSAPPMHGTLARLQLRGELGRDPEEVFADFEREPFAAASLGQVHRARLATGEALAVKIQYPGIDRSIATDFGLLERLLAVSGWSASHPELHPVLEEVRSHMAEETDYVREADAMEEIAGHLEDEDGLRVPRVWRGLSTQRVLTMERLDGLHVEEFLRTGPSQEERDRAATRLLDLFFRQTLGLGLFQADPHPGNFLFLPDGGLGLLDFGCTKRLESGFRTGLRRLFEIPVDDQAALTGCYVELGILDPGSGRYGEQLALLLAMQRLDAAKYHRAGLFDFGDASFLRALTACLHDQLRGGLAHPDFTLYVRTKLGLYNLFHQLGARIDCRRTLERQR
ncbi:MAG: AarF/ABC1/UbiB kinase family protein [Acidobacteriota bacterium]